MRLLSSVILLALCLPGAAQANVGVPTLFVFGPLMFLALGPIIGIEAWVLASRLGVSIGEAVRASTYANLASTLIGVPFAWIATLFLGLFARPYDALRGKRTITGRVVACLNWAFWVPPGQSAWMLPGAMLWMLLPCFLASWAIEFQVEAWQLGHASATPLNQAVLLGNLASYGVMSIFLLWQFLAGLNFDPLPEEAPEEKIELPRLAPVVATPSPEQASRLSESAESEIGIPDPAAVRI